MWGMPGQVMLSYLKPPPEFGPLDFGLKTNPRHQIIRAKTMWQKRFQKISSKNFSGLFGISERKVQECFKKTAVDISVL